MRACVTYVCVCACVRGAQSNFLFPPSNFHHFLSHTDGILKSLLQSDKRLSIVLLHYNDFQANARCCNGNKKTVVFRSRNTSNNDAEL